MARVRYIIQKGNKTSWIKSIFLYAAPSQIHDPRVLLPTEPIPQNLSNEAISEHPHETKNEANTTESITGDPNAGESQVEQVQVAYIHDPNGANGQNTENTGWTVNDTVFGAWSHGIMLNMVV